MLPLCQSVLQSTAGTHREHHLSKLSVPFCIIIVPPCICQPLLQSTAGTYKEHHLSLFHSVFSYLHNLSRAHATVPRSCTRTFCGCSHRETCTQPYTVRGRRFRTGPPRCPRTSGHWASVRAGDSRGANWARRQDVGYSRCLHWKTCFGLNIFY